MSGLCVVFANLKPKKLAGIFNIYVKGFESNGMVMCASNADHTKCEIMRPPEGSLIGERVFV
jgi:aminoacyl tRNA synthase complex-interacting multifunctional protein 1